MLSFPYYYRCEILKNRAKKTKRFDVIDTFMYEVPHYTIDEAPLCSIYINTLTGEIVPLRKINGMVYSPIRPNSWCDNMTGITDDIMSMIPLKNQRDDFFKMDVITLNKMNEQIRNLSLKEDGLHVYTSNLTRIHNQDFPQLVNCFPETLSWKSDSTFSNIYSEIYIRHIKNTKEIISSEQSYKLKILKDEVADIVLIDGVFYRKGIRGYLFKILLPTYHNIYIPDFIRSKLIHVIRNFEYERNRIGYGYISEAYKNSLIVNPDDMDFTHDIYYPDMMRLFFAEMIMEGLDGHEIKTDEEHWKHTHYKLEKYILKNACQNKNLIKPACDALIECGNHVVDSDVIMNSLYNFRNMLNLVYNNRQGLYMKKNTEYAIQIMETIFK